jgi:hypothetical protein
MMLEILVWRSIPPVANIRSRSLSIFKARADSPKEDRSAVRLVPESAEVEGNEWRGLRRL